MQSGYLPHLHTIIQALCEAEYPMSTKEAAVRDVIPQACSILASLKGQVHKMQSAHQQNACAVAPKVQ